MHNLRVKNTLLSETPGPEASQATAGPSFVQNKNEKKMQKIIKTNHKLDSILHNPRSDRGVTSQQYRKLLKAIVF